MPIGYTVSPSNFILVTLGNNVLTSNFQSEEIQETMYLDLKLKTLVGLFQYSDLIVSMAEASYLI